MSAPHSHATPLRSSDAPFRPQHDRTAAGCKPAPAQKAEPPESLPAANRLGASEQVERTTGDAGLVQRVESSPRLAPVGHDRCIPIPHGRNATVDPRNTPPVAYHLPYHEHSPTAPRAGG